MSGVEQMRKMNVIRSHKHEIFSETVNKVALSANDDKRIILDDGVSTNALGRGEGKRVWIFKKGDGIGFKQLKKV